MTEVSTAPHNRRLGRGLSALLGGEAPAHEERDGAVRSELREIATTKITRSPFQPRKHFDPEAIGELASSIKEHGILQPLIVREIDKGFQLVAGERRWQAAKKAGLTTVPCRVVDVIDKIACEFALEENLKRKDLNDLEKAQAFRDYLNHFECTIEELAKSLSMNRSTVSNMLRLLELPDPIKQALHGEKLSAGHARALLPLPEDQQHEMCRRIQSENLSVRATEAAVKTLLGRDKPTPEPAPAPVTVAVSTEQPNSSPAPVESVEGGIAGDAGSQGVPPDSGSNPAPQAAEPPLTAQAIADMVRVEGTAPTESEPETIPIAEAESPRTNHVASMEAQLRDLLGVPVQIKLNAKDSGSIVVPFSSNEEFERIVRTLRRSAA
ncbi:MAG: ParB/RepB/Spo0J family partition protein [Planctomycetaceae bacterium]|nr:ParB/RepB/Spo0J family partition protein [Planctomycetaceae bacterium]